jgi:hypothetical protein
VELLTIENLVFVLPLAAAVLFVLAMALGIPAGDHDADIDHGIGGHGIDGESAGAIGSALSFLGIGRAPMGVLIVSWCIVWGVVGLALNQAVEFHSLFPAMAIAGTASVLGTRWVAEGLSRIMPSVETYSVDAAELVSSHADVVHEVTREGGQVRLTDRLGTMRDLNCRTREGQAPIARGTRVVLTHFDESSGVFHVEADS